MMTSQVTALPVTFLGRVHRLRDNVQALIDQHLAETPHTEHGLFRLIAYQGSDMIVNVARRDLYLTGIKHGAEALAEKLAELLSKKITGGDLFVVATQAAQLKAAQQVAHELRAYLDPAVLVSRMH